MPRLRVCGGGGGCVRGQVRRFAFGRRGDGLRGKGWVVLGLGSRSGAAGCSARRERLTSPPSLRRTEAWSDERRFRATGVPSRRESDVVEGPARSNLLSASVLATPTNGMSVFCRGAPCGGARRMQTRPGWGSAGGRLRWAGVPSRGESAPTTCPGPAPPALCSGPFAPAPESEAPDLNLADHSRGRRIPRRAVARSGSTMS